jgi:putative endonuclease
LIYAEPHPRIADALRRERELEGWRRARKLTLVRTLNPTLATLYVPAA